MADWSVKPALSRRQPFPPLNVYDGVADRARAIPAADSTSSSNCGQQLVTRR